MNFKDRNLKTISIILCCVLSICIVALVIYSSVKHKEPKNKESHSISESVDSSKQNEEPVSQNKETKPTEKLTYKYNNDPLTVLVNKENKLPEDWKVDPVKLKNNQAIDRRAYDDLQKMFDDARAEGHEPLIISSYRSHEKQVTLFERKIKQYKAEGNSDEKAKELAAQWVAVPGTSEHELGLALDIVSKENQTLDESQLKSPVQLWLIENSWKYGFILRYPDDKKEITKINFEPWHYRYVGKDAAKEMHENNICLEEYKNK